MSSNLYTLLNELINLRNNKSSIFNRRSTYQLMTFNLVDSFFSFSCQIDCEYYAPQGFGFVNRISLFKVLDRSMNLFTNVLYNIVYNICGYVDSLLRHIRVL